MLEKSMALMLVNISNVLNEDIIFWNITIICTGYYYNLFYYNIIIEVWFDTDDAFVNVLDMDLCGKNQSRKIKCISGMN